MLKRLWVRITLIILIAGVLGFLDLPGNIKQQVIGSESDLATWANNVKFHLGLDLQGGTQLRYRVDTSKISAFEKSSIVEGIKGVIDRRINLLGISEAIVQSSQLGDEYYIIVELPGVKDISEAIERVGKTVQLEFKEQKEEWSVEEKKANDEYNIEASKKAKEILKEAQNPEIDFAQLVREKSEGKNIAGGGVIDFQEESQIDPVLWAQMSQLEAGKIAMVESENAIYIEKILETKKEPKEKENKEQIEASHILISYKGATRAAESVTRSKDDAKKLADELKGKALSGNFATLAKDNSDDTSNKDKGGELGTFARGVMVKAFEDAAFSGEKGSIVGPVETEFGYHIIHVTDKIGAEVKTEEILKIKRQELLIKKKPLKPEGGWVSTGLTGAQFTHATAQVNQGSLGYQVGIQFNDEGTKLFGELTKKNLQKPIAIFLDDVLISVPTVQSAITDGQAVISGRFSAVEANQLASNLNTGALPAPIILIGQNTVGATLGQDALANAAKAGIVGFVILALFLLIYYRLPGIAAILGLCLYGIIVAAVFKLWPVTLTLAGIAGFILSVGMAVDANVLIFARLKEELLAGKSLEAALKAGFDRAWSSVRDSNLSTLITCLILFIFGTNIIRGFAITLTIGVLVSMFTAINLTRAFLDIFIRWFKKPALWKSGFSDKVPAIPFIQKKAWFFGFSGILLIITLGSLFTNGLVQGIDFTGGTLMEVQFNKSVATGQLSEVFKTIKRPEPVSFIPVAYAQQREESVTEKPTEGLALQEAEKNPDLSNTQIQVSGENTFILRMKHIDTETHDRVLTALKALNDNQDVKELRFETIGPTIGATLRQNAFQALGFAIVFMILFIAYAFRKVPKTLNAWRFGIVAVVALLHDVLITVGVFSVFRFEIDTLFITALLTVMGFSIHDTIVVFDRVRENVMKSTGKKSVDEIVNDSLNQTLARSINTSVTTLITLCALYLFASAAIQNFVLALIVGIAIGTYSSIFIAALLLVVWHNTAKPAPAYGKK